MFYVSHGCIRKSALMTMLIILLLSITSFSSVQAELRKNYMENRVEASIGWRGGRDLTFSNNNSGIMNFNLSNGFEFTASYRPWTYLYSGIVYTNYANFNNEVDNYGNISQSQLGLCAFLATPWTQLSSKNNNFYYRAKIGGVLDATGLKVKSSDVDVANYITGRLREHRFFTSAEIGIKCFGSEGTGILYVRLSYYRSIYNFSSDNPNQLDFISGNNDHIVFDIGLSI